MTSYKNETFHFCAAWPRPVPSERTAGQQGCSLGFEYYLNWNRSECHVFLCCAADGVSLSRHAGGKTPWAGSPPWILQPEACPGGAGRDAGRSGRTVGIRLRGASF